MKWILSVTLLLIACGQKRETKKDQGEVYKTGNLLAYLGSMNKYPRVRYSACWGYTAPDGREYALLGVRNGLSIVDITDAPTLVEVAFIKNRTSSWTEIKTFKQYAYVVKDAVNAGIQIIDLSQLPASAALVRTETSIPRSHTLWIDEARGLLFTNGGDNSSVTIWSLADPVNPKMLSSFNGSTYVHDIHIRGTRAYLAEIYSKSFSIYDISDPLLPKLINRVRDPRASYVSFHNISSTDDGRYLLTTEEAEGRAVRIWDISDEKKPVALGRYLGPGKMAHNVHVRGGFAHIAHYGGGYRVVDISDPTHPSEVAYFDEDSRGQLGSVQVWEVYPYFKSGKVIMSSMSTGLYVTEFK